MADSAALTAAKKAYSDLISGKSVAEFQDQNGERLRYGRADMQRLSSYIQQLERECADADVGDRGPLRMVF